MAHATADGQGRFRFPGLPPGDVWVGAYVLRDGKVRWQQHAAATHQRPRRAEAERDAARAFAQGLFLTADAQSARLREELNAIEDSLAWHLTEPLREVNLSRKKRRAARG